MPDHPKANEDGYVLTRTREYRRRDGRNAQAVDSIKTT